MAKGFKGGFGGGNMMRQQQQMQQKIMKMQQDVKEAQEAVEAQVFTASVGGGAVSATVNGKKRNDGHCHQARSSGSRGCGDASGSGNFGCQ